MKKGKPMKMGHGKSHPKPPKSPKPGKKGMFK